MVLRMRNVNKSAKSSQTKRNRTYHALPGQAVINDAARTFSYQNKKKKLTIGL